MHSPANVAMSESTSCREVVLLGAGASVDAGVPTSAALTTNLVECVRQQGNVSGAAEALEYVRSALQAHNSRLALETALSGPAAYRSDASGGASSYGANTVDVETLLRALDQLARRNTLELRPFISSWDPTVQQLDSAPQLTQYARRVWEELENAFALKYKRAARDVRNMEHHELGRAFREILQSQSRTGPDAVTQYGLDRASEGVANYLKASLEIVTSSLSSTHHSLGEDVAHALAEAIAHAVQPGDGRLFNDARRELERALVQTVWRPDNAAFDYLRPLVRHAASAQVTIATLNYDNCVELAAKAEGLEVFTGIEGFANSQGIGFDIDGGDVQFLKLHGSANWKRMQGHVGDHPSPPQSLVAEATAEELMHASYHPAIIFGQESKLTAERPFFDLFLAFRDALKRASKLTVVGYSFRDEHVNALIRNWFGETNLSRTIEVVDPGWLSMSAPFTHALRRDGGSRLLIRSGEDGQASKAIPEMYE